MKVVAIVQARLGSTRLPRKVLADVGGRPMIARVLERAAAIRGVDLTVAAVPLGEWELGAAIAEAGFLCYYGASDDVLARYARIATMLRASIVIRITGDCPLLAPDVSRDVLRVFLHAGDYDYVSNVGPGTDGLDTEVFSTVALLEANATGARDDHDREHVTPAIRRAADEAGRAGVVAVPRGGCPVKLSVDEYEDLDRVRRIYGALDATVAGWRDWPATRAALEGAGLWSPVTPRP